MYYLNVYPYVCSLLLNKCMYLYILNQLNIKLNAMVMYAINITHALPLFVGIALS